MTDVVHTTNFQVLILLVLTVGTALVIIGTVYFMGPEKVRPYFQNPVENSERLLRYLEIGNRLSSSFTLVALIVVFIILVVKVSLNGDVTFAEDL